MKLEYKGKFMQEHKVSFKNILSYTEMNMLTGKEKNVNT